MPSRNALTHIGDGLTAVRRTVLRHRRLLAVLFAAAAVLAGLRAASPPSPDLVEVAVAGRDLPAGAVLADDDLGSIALPPDAVPEQLLEAPLGATLAGPVGRGEPITRTRVMGAGLTQTTPGLTAVPVRFSDPAQVALLRVGDHVDVFATDPQAGSTTTVATRVPVLGLPGPAESVNDGSLTGRLVVLGLTSEIVPRVTTATVATYVTFAWSTG